MNTLILAIVIETSIFMFGLILAAFALKDGRKTISGQHPVARKALVSFFKKVGIGLITGHVIAVNLMLLKRHEVPLRFAAELIYGVLMGMLLVVYALVISFTEGEDERI